jgi:HK97 family phage portal protein
MKKESLINRMLKPIGLKLINAVASAERGWSNIYGSFINAAKQNINNDTALEVSAAFACIRAISEDIGKLPFKIYRQTDERTKNLQNSHNLYNILRFRPNPEMTAQAFRETLTAHALGWGNGYAEIQRDTSGEIVALWPMRPDMVSIYRDRSKKLYYHIQNETGGFIDLWPEEVLHIHGLGFDGIAGYNVIRYARESLAIAKASEKFGAAFFGNGCHFGGNLEHPQNLSQEAQARLVSQIEKEHGGVEKSHRLLVLEEGMKFSKNIIDPKESQFLETRQFSVPEICRWFRVPPHKIADLTKSAFSNIEQQNIDYVTDGLLGWCERWEEECWYKLLSDSEKKQSYFFKIVVEGLLRGDIQARTAAYKAQFDMGAISPNEIRELENRNPIAGGDEYFVQLNLTTLKNAAVEQQQTNNDAMINNIAERISAAELREVEKHVKHSEKDSTSLLKFRQWCSEFYAKHDEYVCKQIEPLNLKEICLDLLSLKNALMASDMPMGVFEIFKNVLKKNISIVLKGACNEK